jgi:hypothetical protein
MKPRPDFKSFDFVKCDHPLPDPALQGSVFRTRSLARCLERYTITVDGRLVRHAPEGPPGTKDRTSQPTWSGQSTATSTWQDPSAPMVPIGSQLRRAFPAGPTGVDQGAGRGAAPEAPRVALARLPTTAR